MRSDTLEGICLPKERVNGRSPGVAAIQAGEPQHVAARRTQREALADQLRHAVHRLRRVILFRVGPAKFPVVHELRAVAHQDRVEFAREQLASYTRLLLR